MKMKIKTSGEAMMGLSAFVIAIGLALLVQPNACRKTASEVKYDFSKIGIADMNWYIHKCE